MQTKVLREPRLVKEELRKWDEHFFTKHGRLANNNDNDDFKQLSHGTSQFMFPIKACETYTVTKVPKETV